MKSKFSKIMMGIASGIIMVLLFHVKAQAATANVSVSSANGTKGDTVTVTVSVSADEEAMGQIGIAYDTNYLEYISDGTNGGVAGLVLSVLNDIPAGQTQTISLNFRLKETGTTSVTVAANTQILAVNASDPENAAMNLNKADGIVTINAASTASSDSHLSGLTIQAVTQNGDSTNVVYTPSFSPDVYEYRADLAANVARLVVATTLSDSNATTTVSGTRIDPGNNKTTITVKAQDGSQSVYTLYTTRATETTAEPATDEETPTVTGFDRTPKLIKELGKYIIQDFTLTTIPEGFEESTTEYNGETVAALKGISKPLTLLCLADDAQGTNIDIYIYNEASGAINKMVNITSAQKMYTVIPTDESYTGPEGYIQTSLEINGDIVIAWIKSADSEFYVVYAMNWEGEKALYVYDTKEKTLQRFVEGNKSESFGDEPEEENTEYLRLKRQYDELQKKYDDSKVKINKMWVAFGVMIIIVSIGITILFYRVRSIRSFDVPAGVENVEEELDEIGGSMDETGKEEEVISEITDEDRFEAKRNKLQRYSGNIKAAANENEDASNEEIGAEIEKAAIMEETGRTAVPERKATENSSMKETKTVKNNPVNEEREEILINMEDDEPFEIEFFDLDDNKKV